MDDFKNSPIDINIQPGEDRSALVSTPAPTPVKNPAATQAETKPKAVSKSILIFAGIVMLLLIGIVLYSLTKSKNTAESTPIQETPAESPAVNKQDILVETESYLVYDQTKFQTSSNKKRVLFFAASWCPTCSKLDIDIQNNIALIDNNTVIFKVDYDSASDLKSQYSITNQHTLISVNSNGAEVKRLIGTPTLSDLLINI